MHNNEVKKISIILSQFGGPIKLNYQTIANSNITKNIVNYHINNIENIDKYSITDIFSLYYVILYALNDLGENEFSLVTGLDLYKDGYKILNEVKKLINK